MQRVPDTARVDGPLSNGATNRYREPVVHGCELGAPLSPIGAAQCFYLRVYSGSPGPASALNRVISCSTTVSRDDAVNVGATSGQQNACSPGALSSIS